MQEFGADMGGGKNSTLYTILVKLYSMHKPSTQRWRGRHALIITTRKLRPYFHAYPIVVIIDQPFRQTLRKPEASECLVKWSVELSEFDIS